MKKLFLIVLVFSGCNDMTNINEIKAKDYLSNSCSEYPKIVDSLGVIDLYDSARWFIYTWNCDIIYKPKPIYGRKNISFGELQLIFKEISLTSDSLKIYFDFASEGYRISSDMTTDYLQFCGGVLFDIKTRKKLRMISVSGFSEKIEGNNNRFENPFNEEVANYVHINKSKLDKCFTFLLEQKKYF